MVLSYCNTSSLHVLTLHFTLQHTTHEIRTNGAHFGAGLLCSSTTEEWPKDGPGASVKLRNGKLLSDT